MKWKSGGIEDCTYMPASHISIVLRHQFKTAEISADRLNSKAELITRAVQKRLSSRNPDSIIPIHFDVLRFVFGDCKEKLVPRYDFQKLPTCPNWFYKLNSIGEGLQISFPVRVTRRLILKPTWNKCSDGLLRMTAVPVERMKIISAVSACSLATLYEQNSDHEIQPFLNAHSEQYFQ